MKLSTKQELFVMLRHPLVVSLFGGLVVGIVGAFLAAFFAGINLEKQMKLELYKEMITRRGDFVDHLSKDIYDRIYKLSAYCSHLKGSERAIVQKWEIKYQSATEDWSGELRFYLTNLDRYFPPGEYKIGNYIKAKTLFKGALDFSFKNILLKKIQRRFYEAHRKIKDIGARYLRGQKIDKEELADLEKEIDDLYKRVYEFSEGLSKASGYDMIFN